MVLPMHQIIQGRWHPLPFGMVSGFYSVSTMHSSQWLSHNIVAFIIIPWAAASIWSRGRLLGSQDVWAHQDYLVYSAQRLPLLCLSEWCNANPASDHTWYSGPWLERKKNHLTDIYSTSFHPPYICWPSSPQCFLSTFYCLIKKSH